MLEWSLEHWQRNNSKIIHREKDEVNGGIITILEILKLIGQLLESAGNQY